MIKIKKAVVNWFYTTEFGEDYLVLEVGKEGVKYIHHDPIDKFLRVERENMKKDYYYNINSIHYE